MPLKFSSDRVTLAGTCIETLLYGINVVLYTMSTYLLTHRKKDPKKSAWHLSRDSFLLSPMFIITTIMFLCNTAHWAIDIFSLFDAFIYVQGRQTPAAYFSDWARKPEVWKVAFMNVALLFGDALMIYRTWIVWNQSIAVIVFPLLTLLGAAVCYTGIIIQFTRIPSDGTAWFIANVLPWVTGDCVFTLCVNLYTTVMIAYRIIRHNYELNKLNAKGNYKRKGSGFSSVLALITESAAFYTAWTIFFFATDERQDSLEPFFNVTWASVSAFAAFLINLRVGLGWAQSNTLLPSTTGINNLSEFEATPDTNSDARGLQFVHMSQLSSTEIGAESRSGDGKSLKKQTSFA